MNLDRLKQQLHFFEDLRHKPYVDTVGKITIGVGRNLTDRGLSLPEIEMLLSNDIWIVTSTFDQLIPWWRKLDEVRQRALCDLGFNIGPHKLVKTFPIFIGQVQRGEWDAAAANLRSTRWYRQTRRRAPVVTRMIEAGEDGAF